MRSQLSHQKTTRWLISLALIAGLASSGVAQAQHLTPATGHGIDLSAVEQNTRYLTDEVKSGLFAYDESPLADRTPLVLVHGIGGTESKLFHWEKFLEFTEKQTEFNRKYKIYLYHYDSTRSVPAISDDLRQTLKGFIGGLGGRDIKILAYSEGGLLTRNALQDPYLNENVSEVLAIATPFHGSPLANPEWMAQQVRTEAPINLMRMAQRIAYRITGRKYPTFREDFHWDNFDGAIPAEQYVKHNGQSQKVDYTLARKTNFTTYGSYFGLDVDPNVLPRELGLDAPPPTEKPVPGNLFRKNLLFSIVRNNIGKLPLAYKAEGEHASLLADANQAAEGSDPDEALALTEVALDVEATEFSINPSTIQVTATHTGKVAKTRSVLEDMPKPDVSRGPERVSMMMYNDGISPISSTLWLGRFTPNFNDVKQPVDRLWDTLKSLKGNRGTRLFAGLDHRNWMEGVTRTGQDELQDLLNPDQGTRTVFEWIIYDLMS